MCLENLQSALEHALFLKTIWPENPFIGEILPHALHFSDHCLWATNVTNKHIEPSQ